MDISVLEKKMKRMQTGDEPKTEGATPEVKETAKEPVANRDMKTEEPKEIEKDVDSTSPKDAVQKRINKLVAEKKSTQEAHEKLRAEFEEFKKKATVKDDTPMKGEPQLKDFNTAGDYASALKKFHTQETSKHVESKLRLENAEKEVKSKYAKMLEMGKKMTDVHGLEPDEYEDRIKGVEGKLKMHKSAQRELLNSDYGHLIALDIAEDPESFSKMIDEDDSGAKQIKWIAKREAHHEHAMTKDEPEVPQPKKTTKAAAPDSRLTSGMGMNDDKTLSKDGKVNWKNIRKAVKGK